MHFEHLAGDYSMFCGFLVPQEASITSIMELIWASHFPLDAAHMSNQHNSKTLGMLRCPKVRNEGPILSITLARKKLPQTFRSMGKASKTCPKNALIFDPKTHFLTGVGRSCVTPYKPSLASVLDRGSQARFA